MHGFAAVQREGGKTSLILIKMYGGNENDFNSCGDKKSERDSPAFCGGKATPES